MQRNAPVRLTSTTRRHSSIVRSSSGTARRARAGVVEEQVEAAEGLLRRLEEGADRLGVGHVGRDGEGPAAVRPRLVDGLRERLGPAAGQDDRVALGQQGEGRRPADPRPRAGDDRCLAERVHRESIPSK